MTEVRPLSGQEPSTVRRRRAVRSTVSVCLALAVIYSSGYSSSSSPFKPAASGSLSAQGAANVSQTEAPTGIVGPQLLDPSVSNLSDSLVPGQKIAPSPKGSPSKAAAEKVKSTMERPGKGMLVAPLQFLNASSAFGLRTSPITGEHNEFHTGQDFAAPCGTRVFSADAGVVRAVGWHPWGGGNRVELDHGNGLVTTYNHLEGIAVKKGDEVGAGQVIATVGTSGSSTGCHLHFETILNGEHTDPAKWKLIPIKGSGPIDLPTLMNFGPGGANEADGERAWATYLAGATPIEQLEAPAPEVEKPKVEKTAAKPSASAKPSAKPSARPTAKPSPDASKPSVTDEPTGSPTTKPTDPPVTEPTKPPTKPTDPPVTEPTKPPTKPTDPPVTEPTEPAEPTVPAPTPAPTTEFCARGADALFGTGDEVIGEVARQFPDALVVPVESVVHTLQPDGTVTHTCGPVEQAPAGQQEGAAAAPTAEPSREAELAPATAAP